MLLLRRTQFRTQFLSIAAAGVLVALTAGSTPVRADELAQNLGPVGPHEPILATVGNKRVIAFYQPDSGNCAVQVVVWNTPDVIAESTVGFETTLNPRQVAHINTPENEPLYLQCGDKAATLAVIGAGEFIAVGVTK
jgi:hypothetical protein